MSDGNLTLRIGAVPDSSLSQSARSVKELADQVARLRALQGQMSPGAAPPGMGTGTLAGQQMSQVGGGQRPLAPGQAAAQSSIGQQAAAFKAQVKISEDALKAVTTIQRRELAQQKRDLEQHLQLIDSSSRAYNKVIEKIERLGEASTDAAQKQKAMLEGLARHHQGNLQERMAAADQARASIAALTPGSGIPPPPPTTGGERRVNDGDPGGPSSPSRREAVANFMQGAGAWARVGGGALSGAADLIHYGKVAADENRAQVMSTGNRVLRELMSGDLRGLVELNDPKYMRKYGDVSALKMGQMGEAVGDAATMGLGVASMLAGGKGALNAAAAASGASGVVSGGRSLIKRGIGLFSNTDLIDAAQSQHLEHQIQLDRANNPLREASLDAMMGMAGPRINAARRLRGRGWNAAWEDPGKSFGESTGFAESMLGMGGSLTGILGFRGGTEYGRNTLARRLVAAQEEYKKANRGLSGERIAMAGRVDSAGGMGGVGLSGFGMQSQSAQQTEDDLRGTAVQVLDAEANRSRLREKRDQAEAAYAAAKHDNDITRIRTYGAMHYAVGLGKRGFDQGAAGGMLLDVMSGLGGEFTESETRRRQEGLSVADQRQVGVATQANKVLEDIFARGVSRGVTEPKYLEALGKTITEYGQTASGRIGGTEGFSAIANLLIGGIEQRPGRQVTMSDVNASIRGLQQYDQIQQGNPYFSSARLADAYGIMGDKAKIGGGISQQYLAEMSTAELTAAAAGAGHEGVRAAGITPEMAAKALDHQAKQLLIKGGMQALTGSAAQVAQAGGSAKDIARTLFDAQGGLTEEGATLAAGLKPTQGLGFDEAKSVLRGMADLGTTADKKAMEAALGKHGDSAEMGMQAQLKTLTGLLEEEAKQREGLVKALRQDLAPFMKRLGEAQNETSKGLQAGKFFVVRVERPWDPDELKDVGGQ